MSPGNRGADRWLARYKKERAAELAQAMRKGGPVEQDFILQFFNYTHLTPELQEVSKPFNDLAVRITQLCPRNAERTVALRKLLESKDAAVRARIAKVHNEPPPSVETPPPPNEVEGSSR